MKAVQKLIVFSGLPGVGKSTVARAVAGEFGYVYLRVDSIETPFSQKMKVVGEGYEALVNVTRENLSLSNSVVVDLVNPLHLTRRMFLELAQQSEADIVQFECVLYDKDEHRRRLENRMATDQHNPSWQEVLNREYEVWDEYQDGERTIIDTSSDDQAIRKIKEILA